MRLSQKSTWKRECDPWKQKRWKNKFKLINSNERRLLYFLPALTRSFNASQVTIVKLRFQWCLWAICRIDASAAMTCKAKDNSRSKWENKRKDPHRIWKDFCGLGLFVWTRCTMLCECHTTPTQKLFCLHVFRQVGPPQRVDCLAPRWETALSVFPKDTSTRYRIRSQSKVS